MTLRRPLAAATLALALALALGGCAMTPESRLDDYRAEAETLTADLLAAIPPALVDGEPVVESSERVGETASTTPQPADPMWWNVTADQQLTAVADASESAAAAVSAALEGDGWTKRRAREADGGETVYDAFRRGAGDEEWYVEVMRVRAAKGERGLVRVLVASPVTVRGDG